MYNIWKFVECLTYIFIKPYQCVTLGIDSYCFGSRSRIEETPILKKICFWLRKFFSIYPNHLRIFGIIKNLAFLNLVRIRYLQGKGISSTYTGKIIDFQLRNFFSIYRIRSKSSQIFGIQKKEPCLNWLESDTVERGLPSYIHIEKENRLLFVEIFPIYPIRPKSSQILKIHKNLSYVKFSQNKTKRKGHTSLYIYI